MLQHGLLLYFNFKVSYEYFKIVNYSYILKYKIQISKLQN